MKNPDGVSVMEKRRRAFEMIRLAKNSNKMANLETAFDKAKELHDHNPALVFDEKGRLVRWVKTPTKF